MAIEPLSSVMTFQAQDTVKPKVQTIQPVDMEVSPDEQKVNVDSTTATVAKAQEEDSEAGKDSEKEKNADNNSSAQRKELNPSQAATEQLKKAIAEMNQKISNTNEEAVFGVHEDTNRIMIKIIDKDTKEIIKEFPPEKTLDMIAKVWEVAGILVDEKR